MFHKKALHNNDMCRVCLSIDRTLTPIGKYLELFTKICRKLKPAYKTKDLLICWECQMLLQKAEKFKKNAIAAQKILKNYDNLLEQNVEGHHTFSTLQSVLKTETNYFFLENEMQPNKSIDQNVIKKEDNNDLKYSDKTCNINTEKAVSFNAGLEPSTASESYDEKVGRLDVIKHEKVELNEELLNDLFKVNIDEITDFKGEIDDHQYDDFLYLENFTQKKKKVKKNKTKYSKKHKPRPYKVVHNSLCDTSGDMTRLFETVPIDTTELMELREKEKTMKHYLKMPYKCEWCIIGYPQKSSYLQHMKRHDKSRKFECDICHQRFVSKSNLVVHCASHSCKLVCRWCGAAFLRRRRVLLHVRNAHERAYECRVCGRQFAKKEDLFTHYKTHLEFICDHCGKRALQKHVLEKHIRVLHLPHICKICNIRFKSYRNHQNHIQEKHVKTRTEEAFCVECNMQFDNVPIYKRHLSTSVKHRPKSDIKYPCPECNKLFNKKMNMKYHYNYFHTDRTNFYCDPCAKYFLNNYQLRRHKAVFHDKIKPVKNKFCPHCGRGFSERRILNNHIRTHTGERPFVCALCSAAFTQAYPLTTHMRAVHKIRQKPLTDVK